MSCRADLAEQVIALEVEVEVEAEVNSLSEHLYSAQRATRRSEWPGCTHPWVGPNSRAQLCGLGRSVSVKVREQQTKCWALRFVKSKAELADVERESELSAVWRLARV